jgi:predicted phage-related endonuclease
MNKLEYLDVEQRSPEWFKVRLGRATASRLSDLMARSKKDGSPLKACTDYQRELWFERKFGVSFNNYVTDAMLEGQIYEQFALQQYKKIKGGIVASCGCYYNDKFVASPDGIVGLYGLLEIKILRDNTFTEVLLSGVPEKHFLQIQGQLMASGAKWCDYVAVNLSTKKISIWRVLPNAETFKAIEEAINAEVVIEEVGTTELYDIQGDIPVPTLEAGAIELSNETSPWQ